MNEWNMHKMESYLCLAMSYPFFSIVPIYGCCLSIAQTLHSLSKKEPNVLCGLV